MSHSGHFPTDGVNVTYLRAVIFVSFPFCKMAFAYFQSRAPPACPSLPLYGDGSGPAFSLQTSSLEVSRSLGLTQPEPHAAAGSSPVMSPPLLSGSLIPLARGEVYNLGVYEGRAGRSVWATSSPGMKVVHFPQAA